MSIAFNGKYIYDVLNLLEDDFIWIMLNTPVMPVVFKSLERENYTFIVMPVRLKKRKTEEDMESEDDVPADSYT